MSYILLSNGVDVFRIFDALNDTRNMETAIKATIDLDGHAQGTMSYTTSPVHNMQTWLDLANKLQDLGCHTLAIKDMAGLLDPYVGYELVSKLKESIEIPIHLHSHATTGMSTTTAIKCIEAGLDNVDTSISSMSMTYGHSATETVVGILKDTQYETDIKIDNLAPIAKHFREVRKKYADFEGSLKGVDARIITSQVPGGMLTNLESQLKERIEIPIHLHSHATTGMSTTTAIKCIEAGLDNVDTSISSMSMTYGHSATETVVGILESTEYETDIKIDNLAPIAKHFREVRKKYADFEGSLKGVDARIITSQVPGGMLTNLESQLKEQNAVDKFDEVIDEIPNVRSDLGYIPLVTPTSQIVGTQAVINVLNNERYKVITKENQAILKGEYGKTPAG